jgi:hypothetical protein
MLLTPRDAKPVPIAIGLTALIVGILLVYPGRAWREDSSVALYRDYASACFAGQFPYRHYAIEYPPLGLAVMLVPRLLGAEWRRFFWTFVAEILAFNAVTMGLLGGWLERRASPRRAYRGLAWYFAAFLILTPLSVIRYDVVPMTLSFAGALGWSSGRAIAGGSLVAAGTLAKVYPGFIGGVMLVAELKQPRGSRLRGTLALGLVTAAGLGLWYAFGGPGVLGTWRYASERGLEIGSIYAGLLLGASRVAHAAVTIGFDHGSWSVVWAPWSDRLARASLAFQLVALLAVMARSAWSGRREPVRYAGAAVLAFTCFGKVLSPQYLLWYLPFAAALGGRTGRVVRAAYLGACVLTTAIVPWGFHALLAARPWAVLILNLRNLLLVLTFVVVSFGPDADEDETAQARLGSAWRPTKQPAA